MISRIFSCALGAFSTTTALLVLGCSGSGRHLEAGAEDDGGGTLPPGVGGAVGGFFAGSGGAFGGAGGSVVAVCGEPGTPCCSGNSCGNGGCCVAGICMAVGGSCVGLGGGVCNAGACGTCGGAGLACCTGSSGAGTCTAPQTRCTGGICARCGELGGPCCANPAGGSGTCSAAGAICSADLCIACGTPGAACCPGNQCASGCCYGNTCLGEGTACGTGGGTCQAGRCSGCGSAAQVCCANLCYDGLLCRSGTCTACGGSGLPCCPGGGAAPGCQDGLACTGTGSDGVCARCGGLGDICCGGNQCGEGGCCSGGRCVAVSTGACTADAGSDAPATGTGGTRGTGGIGGTGGITGKGGIAGTGGVVGSGGKTGSGGATSTGGCGALIDDMESGTGYICQTTGRKGMWYTYIDSSAYSSVTPRTGVAALPELMSTPRTSSSTRAMHMSGTYSTYVGLACWLNNVSFSSIPGTYNGSGYTGIRFYAKGKGSLIVVGQTPATESYLYGGTCPSSSCAGNQYTVGALSSSWTLYTVPFTYLRGGEVEPFDPSDIWSLEFMFYSATSLSGAAFDLWVDDLVFY